MDPKVRKPVLASFGCGAVLGTIAGIAIAMGVLGILLFIFRGPFRDITAWLDALIVPARAIGTGLYFPRGELRDQIQESRLKSCFCKRCGYDLRGSTNVCPECGTGIPDRQRRRIIKMKKNAPK